MSLPDTPTGLYWSVRGEVACINHLPPARVQQKADGWQPIPLAYDGTFQCQHCSADHTALVHPHTHAASNEDS